MSVFAVERRFDDGFVYGTMSTPTSIVSLILDIGQPFWMTVGSTVISLLTNITLIYDYVTTKDFENSGSGLTRKQRSVSGEK